MQCASCLADLTTVEEVEKCLCNNCQKRKEMAELRLSTKLLEWKGVLSPALDLPGIENHFGKTVKIEIFELEPVNE